MLIFKGAISITLNLVDMFFRLSLLETNINNALHQHLIYCRGPPWVLEWE